MATLDISRRDGARTLLKCLDGVCFMGGHQPTQASFVLNKEMDPELVYRKNSTALREGMWHLLKQLKI